MHASQTKARVEEDVKGLLKIHEGLTYPELPEHQYLLSTSLSQTWAPRYWPMSSVEGLFASLVGAGAVDDASERGLPLQ